MSFAFIRKRSKNYIVYLEYKDKNSGKKVQKKSALRQKNRYNKNTVIPKSKHREKAVMGLQVIQMRNVVQKRRLKKAAQSLRSSPSR